jgi:hypothetical protein
MTLARKPALTYSGDRENQKSIVIKSRSIGQELNPFALDVEVSFQPVP